jgi:hypothetical protein
VLNAFTGIAVALIVWLLWPIVRGTRSPRTAKLRLALAIYLIAALAFPPLGAPLFLVGISLARSGQPLLGHLFWMAPLDGRAIYLAAAAQLENYRRLSTDPVISLDIQYQAEFEGRRFFVATTVRCFARQTVAAEALEAKTIERFPTSLGDELEIAISPLQWIVADNRYAYCSRALQGERVDAGKSLGRESSLAPHIYYIDQREADPVTVHFVINDAPLSHRGVTVWPPVVRETRIPRARDAITLFDLDPFRDLIAESNLPPARVRQRWQRSSRTNNPGITETIMYSQPDRPYERPLMRELRK